MTRSLLLILFIAAIQPLIAQHACQTISTDSTELQLCYFTSGKLSTYTAHLKRPSDWYMVKIYDTTGHVTYERNYGKRYGSSQLALNYNENGGVMSAYYTVPTDSGSKNKDIITYFTPGGKVDHEDNNFTTALISSQKGANYSPTPYVELYVVNYTSDKLHINVQNKDIKASSFAVDVEPSETAKLGLYNTTTPSEDPFRHFDFHITNKPRKGYGYAYRITDDNNSTKKLVMILMHKVMK